jgi:hypothetical protein
LVQTFPPPVLTGSGSTGHANANLSFEKPPEVQPDIDSEKRRHKRSVFKIVNIFFSLLFTVFMLIIVTFKHQEKGRAHGMMRVTILCGELAIIWLIYFSFGFITTYDMPLWMTTFMVITVDRLTNLIADFASRRRTRLSQ